MSGQTMGRRIKVAGFRLGSKPKKRSRRIILTFTVAALVFSSAATYFSKSPTANAAPVVCAASPQTISGNAQAWTKNSTWQGGAATEPPKALNAPDGVGVQLWQAQGNVFTLDMANVIPAGEKMSLYLQNVGNTIYNGNVRIESSVNGTTFTNPVNVSATSVTPTSSVHEYTAPTGGTRYVRFTPLANGQSGTAVRVDAVTYSYQYAECNNTNFVQNGGFESSASCSTQTGTFNNWQVIATNVHIYGPTCPQGWPVPEGVNSVDLDGSTTGGVRQTLTGLTPGTTYNLTFQQAFNPAAGASSASMRVQVANFDRTYTSASSANADGFSRVHVTFTASATSHVMSFTSLTGTGNTALLDNGGAQGFGVVLDEIRVTAADCPPCPIDFGDAPSSYKTLLADDGPRHSMPSHDPAINTSPLQLGANVSAEANGQPGATASIDTFDDGVSGPIIVTTSQAKTVNVSVTNNASEPATLAGWIDLNSNGTFDTSERVTVNVPANSGTASYPVVFPAGTPTGDTFARFRLFSGTVADPLPTGSAFGGEVEDYAVTVEQPPFVCGENVYITRNSPTNLAGVNMSANPLTFNNIGPTASMFYNGTAYSPVDDYIYGVYYNATTSIYELIRTGGDGFSTSLGQITGGGINGIDVTMGSGEISPTGVYYVKDASSTNQIFSIDIDTRTAELITLTVPAFVSHDLAWYNNFLWTVGTDGNLYRINPATGATNNFGSVGLTTPTFTAMFGGTNGIYGMLNTGGLYKIQTTANDADALLIANTPSGASDAAKCATQPTNFETDLAITKTDNKPDYQAGVPNTYTIVARNNGPFGAQNVAIADALPADTLTASWTCGSPTGGGVCGTASGTGAINTTADLPAGATVTYTFKFTTQPNRTGNLVNTATITPGQGTTDANTGNNSATDTDTLNVPVVRACSPEGLLFQTESINGNLQPTNEYKIDMVTGQVVGTPITYSNPDRVINATGYNTKDNFVYGWMTEPITRADIGIARINADGTYALLGKPAGIVADANFAVGDVDENGFYWLLTSGADGETWYKVDLNPGANYLKVVDTGTITLPATINTFGNDWSYVPGGGDYLYSLGRGTTITETYLMRFNRTTGVVSRAFATNMGTYGNNLVGATYADANGNLYASVNETGQIVRVNVTTGARALFATGEPSGGNDGARCANAPLPIDFGDAPNALGTLLANAGARHGVPSYNATTHTAPLMLGSLIDIEPDGLPNVTATGDNTTDINDEDAVTGPIELVSGITNTINVTVTNNNAQAATLVGWVDLDGDNVFEAGERIMVNVPASSGTASYPLTFPASTLPNADLYARFRVFSGAVANPLPTGNAAAGEVEDYLVTVEPPTLTLNKTTQGASGGPFGFTLSNTYQTTGTATTTAPNTPIQVDGDTGTAGTQPFTVVDRGANLVITESSLPAGWSISNITCTNAAGTTVGTRSAATYTIPSAQVMATSAFTCGYTNTATPATVSLSKVTEQIAGGPFNFTLTNTVQSNGGVTTTAGNSPAQVDGNTGTAGTQPFTVSTLGSSITITESSLPAGWSLADFSCTVGGNPVGSLTGSTYTIPGASVTPGATFSCTATNEPSATLTLYKVTQGGAGGPFDFALTNTNLSAASVSTVSANTPTQVDGDPLVAGNQTFTILDVTDDVVITESSLPNTWSLNNFTCTNQAGTTVGSLAGSTYTIPAAAVGASPAFTCTATNAPREVDLRITKDDGSSTYSAGSNVTYQIVVTNDGPDAVSNAKVVDNLPSGITTANWTCGSPINGGSCDQANGTGAINTTADLPSGASVTYSLTLVVPSNFVGALSNTATVTAPTGILEANLNNNSATDVDTQSPAPASSTCSIRTFGGTNNFTVAPFGFTATASVTNLTSDPVSTNVIPFTDNQGVHHNSGIPSATRWLVATDPTMGLTITFSQPVPANLIALQIGDIGNGGTDAYNPSFTVSLSGTGTTATRADFNMTNISPRVSAVYNPATGVITKTSATQSRESAVLIGNSTDLVRTISIAGTGIVGDSISFSLLSLPSCVTMQKISSPNTDSFTFNSTNTTSNTLAPITNTTITTTAPNTPASSPIRYSQANADVTMSEVVPLGWNLDSAVCVDRNASATGNPGSVGSLSSTTYTIPASNVRISSDIACTFTDSQDIDYSDAPNSYGTDSANNGANHSTVAGLGLGAVVDAETNGQPSADAAADDTTTLADEDAVGAPIEVITSQPTTVNVSVANTTSQPATLAGWLDLNNNGTFDSGERITVAIPANSGTASYPVIFPAGTPTADTFARFRLFSGTVADPSPTGFAAGGEVEDYAVAVAPATITLTKTTSGKADGPFAFTLTNTTQTNGTVTTSAPDTPTQVDGDTGTAGVQDFSVASRTADVVISESTLPAGWTLASFTCVNEAGTTVGSLSGTTYTIPADQIAASPSFDCAATNNPAPATITLNKATNNGVGGPFNFSLTNTAQASGTVTTTAEGVATQVDGNTGTAGTQPFAITNFGQDVVITEATAAGWDLTNITCTADGAPVGSRSANAFTIPGSAINAAGKSFDCTFTNEKIRADLAITKTDGKNTYNPGTDNVYTIVARNNGPYPVTDAAVVDTLPAGTTASWTCGSATGGGVCDQTNGTGSINTTVDLPVGASVTYTLTLSIPASLTGDLANTATITAPSTVTEINTANNTATDTDQLIRDFADAPAGYGTATTGHTTLPGLTLGTGITFEPSAHVSDDALGDVDDSIASPIVIAPGQATSVTVSATNTTGTDATLAGWIDLNGNGTFEAGERVMVTVPANSGTADYTLNFPGGIATADTFARFRLFSGTVADPSATGQANGGEVEDYPVQVARVQYRKTVTPAPSGPLAPGQTFTYTITAENVGSTTLTGLTFDDDMTAVVDDATYNNDATATSGTLSYTAPTLSWNGDLVPGDSATITYTVTTNNPITGDAILINNIIGTGPASNCTPVTTLSDPNCFVRIPQPDVASTKILVGPTNPKSGDEVTYRFIVKNNGPAGATGVVIGDDLSGVLDDASYNANATADIGTATFNATNQQITWTGDLAASGSAGDTATIEYTVTVNDADNLGDSVLKNGLISPGCPNPPIYDPADPSYVADCVTVTPIEAWTATKTVSPAGPVKPGDTLTYTVSIQNTGGVDLTGISVTDNLTDDLDDATYNSATAASGSVNYTTPNLVWTGNLAQGASTSFTYTMTVKGAKQLGNGELVNTITGPMNCPNPAITDPTDPAYNADCITVTPIEAWTVVKTSSATGPVEAGDTVEYTLTIENTGSANLNNLSAGDNMGGVLDDATYNSDASATIGSVSYTAPSIAWNGNLDPGQTATVTYSVTVNPASHDGDGKMINAVTGGTCPTPAITNPSDANFDPDCVNIVDVKEWVAAKTATPAGGTVTPGQVVTYNITVENTGGTNLTGADAPSVSDSLAAILDDATYRNDAAASIGTPAYAAPNLTWSNNLNVGQAATISYSVQINKADAIGDGVMNNAITGPPNCPNPAITNSADPSFNPDCVTIHRVAAWTVAKTSSATGPVVAGDIVNYTLEIENTGAVDLSGISTADNLSGVLDDATYRNDATATIGTVNFTSPNLTWTGNLPVGQTSTVMYSVAINPASAAGDGSLRNAVVGGQCPNPAITNSADPNFNPDCVVIVPVREWIAAKTASPAGAVKPGDTVKYTVTVRNTGTADLTGANAPAINDNLTEVLDDANYNNDAAAAPAGMGAPTYNSPILNWTNDLNVGQTATITYSATAKAAGDLGDGNLVNAITGPPNCPNPAITNSADPNFNPDCVKIVQIAAFITEKTSNPKDGSEVKSGDKITYTVTIKNTGALSLTTFSFTDNLSDVLDDANLVGDETVSPSSMGTVSRNGNTMTFNGNIPAGQTATVTYQAQVKPYDQLGNKNVRNVLVAPYSLCMNANNPDCITEHPVVPSNPLANTGMNLNVIVAGIIAVVVSAVLLMVYRLRLKNIQP